MMSARSSRAWLVLARATRNTYAPFLYQTRTLAAVPVLRYQHRQLERQQIRSLTTEPQRQPQKEEDDETDFLKDDDFNKQTKDTSSSSEARSGRRSFLKRRAASVTVTPALPSNSSKTTTPLRPLTMMTSSEKQAFGELLEALGAGVEKKPAALPTLSAWPPPPTSPEISIPDSDPSPSFSSSLESLDPDEAELESGDVSSKGPTQAELDEMSQISAIFDTVLQDLRARKVRQQRQEQRKQEEKGKSSLVTTYSTSYYAGGEDQATSRTNASLTEFIEARMNTGDFLDSQLTDWLARQLVSTERAIEAVITRESNVIQAALLDAVKRRKGDIKLWDVCRTKVFPLVGILERSVGMETEYADVAKAKADAEAAVAAAATESWDMVPVTEDLADVNVELKDAEDSVEEEQGVEERKIEEKKEGEEKKKEAVEEAAVEEAAVEEAAVKKEEWLDDAQYEAPYELSVPEGVPLTSVVTRLYPQMLLVAFRLLNLHHPASPLIGQFRATIRSMGPTSTLLGGSTELYNELMYFYWRGCQDVPAVVALVQEMDIIGVEPDQRTLRLLYSISAQRRRDVEAHWHRNIQSVPKPEDPSKRARVGRETWWDLAPNRKAYFALFGEDGWIDKIKVRVEELRRNQQVALTKSRRQKKEAA
ncbi:uncharacterized protein BO97DRAFT_445297 [Aspergillus homomorphus CBS 101889]|uniref:Mtf2-like C-terminal domain-containing protein n=1 Tax=Aspergillus homomorphus (strain CBS 101889) TaxID=1450537 RepID=A0A395HTQ7_ASPHC|nr:hypothetical protein BO97DRAFT_445297 [Aspergillus homomorphus CBS 101889]RAL09594.1 hypothetical protein BO97DRAFT_445297 [Aspergillus homomorphus CBS 101889]